VAQTTRQNWRVQHVLAIVRAFDQAAGYAHLSARTRAISHSVARTATSHMLRAAQTDSVWRRINLERRGTGARLARLRGARRSALPLLRFSLLYLRMNIS